MAQDYSFLLSNNLTNGHYTLFACGNDAPTLSDWEMIETKLGYKLPDDFKDYSMSSLGGLYVEVNEDLWPRPQVFDVAPFWTFLYGLYVYGMSGEVPDWMDIREYSEFQETTKSKYLPFMKIIGDANFYCFGADKKIYQWDHETDEFELVDKTFIDILNMELHELEKRKEEKLKLAK
jgi:hypothetical protein